MPVSSAFAGLFAGMNFTATASGTYFVEVKALTAAGAGAYGLVVSAGNRISYGVEMAAAVLYREGNTWAATPGAAATLTWGLRQSGPALDANDAPATVSVLSLAQIAAAEHALASYAEVADVTFVRVNPGGTTNNATVLVGAYRSIGDGSGAYAFAPGSRDAASVDGDLWINTAYVSSTNLAPGTVEAGGCCS